MQTDNSDAVDNNDDVNFDYDAVDIADDIDADIALR